MTNSVDCLYRRLRMGLSAVALLALVSACGSGQLNPSSDAPYGEEPLPGVPTDSSAVPTDSTGSTPPDSTSPDTLPLTTEPGIVFGVYNLRHEYLNSTFNGSMQGLEPEWLMSELVLARSKGGRMILKMIVSPDERVQNADGTFSLDKWKALVYRFRTLSLDSYINDGTLMGIFLIDEPQNKSKWGGKIIPHATVEAMAKYSKGLWPNMTTFVRARPTWLAESTMTYTYLDAGWFQYEANHMGDITTAITSDVAAAKRKGLGIVVGLNVLSGGDGSSGIEGFTPARTNSRWWQMSATEIRNYGTVLLNQTYACAFFNWTYILGGADLFEQPDIKSALASLSAQAKAHVKTPCRQ